MPSNNKRNSLCFPGIWPKSQTTPGSVLNHTWPAHLLWTSRSFAKVKGPCIAHIIACKYKIWHTSSQQSPLHLQANIYLQMSRSAYLGTGLLRLIHPPRRFAFWSVPLSHSNHAARRAESVWWGKSRNGIFNGQHDTTVFRTTGEQ